MNSLITNQYLLRNLAAVFVLSLLAGYSEGAEPGAADHLGEISVQELLDTYTEFGSEFQRYAPTPDELSQIEALRGKQVTVLFGTWCHDSKREVPRLLKLLDESKVELESLTLFAVDRNKADPEGFAQRLDLRYTPTIIVSEDGEEVARVIERPDTGLAADLQSQISP